MPLFPDLGWFFRLKASCGSVGGTVMRNIQKFATAGGCLTVIFFAEDG
jgi:hypothetical protein